MTAPLPWIITVLVASEVASVSESLMIRDIARTPVKQNLRFAPLETRFPYRGYLFYLLLLRRRPTIVQAYHFWLSNNCSRVQERMATSGYLFSRLVTIWP